MQTRIGAIPWDAISLACQAAFHRLFQDGASAREQFRWETLEGLRLLHNWVWAARGRDLGRDNP